MSLDLAKLENVRKRGVKTTARCAACAEAGNDTAGDHCFINDDGGFGCVLYPLPDGKEHRARMLELSGGIKNSRPATARTTSVEPTWTALPSAPEAAPFPSLKHYKHGMPSAHWVYYTAEGRIAGIITRFDIPATKDTRSKKEILPLTWCRDEAGNTAWRPKAMQVPQPLYGLPFTDDDIVIVEGEKCCDAVRAAGLSATTWAGGSSVVHKTGWSSLKGKTICIWPDNDETGMKAKDAIIRALSGIAAEIRVVQIPDGRPVGWDAADTDDEEIYKLVEEAVVVESPADPIDDRPVFPYTRADQLDGTNEIMDFVECLFTEGGASITYGPSNVGKSFWMVDVGVCVATGSPFRDELEVEQGAVVYVALEGEHGAKNRIAALHQSGRLKPGAPFYLVFEQVSLLDPGHADRMATTIAKISEESGVKVKLVILDTMARAMAGGDENSGVDMTTAVKSIDAIRAATGAHVAVVHHSGKNQASGARGHSSLRAAVDTELEVTRPDGSNISTVTVTKQRDLSIREPMPFSLEVVNLGTDRRGNLITSCVVHHEDAMMATKKSKGGRSPSVSIPDLLKLLPQPKTTAWQKAAKEELGVSESAFYEFLKRIREESSAVSTQKVGWHIPEVILWSEKTQ